MQPRRLPQTTPLFGWFGWHLLLALVMLLTQQAGLRHKLQHTTNDDGAATHSACVVCLAHHGSDHSTTPTVQALVLATFEHVLTADAAQPQRAQSVVTGYLPRAPPVFSA
ncbi:MAG: hypothetical protein Q7U28_10840 [Aquabacterium sp.]|nr:hypothetical protein [Aquabacterium sp.]